MIAVIINSVGIALIGGTILASIFGQTPFLTDIVNNPFLTLLTLGRYIYDFFNWLGMPAIGVFFAVIVEIFIAYFLIRFFIFLVKLVKNLINLFRRGKK